MSPIQRIDHEDREREHSKNCEEEHEKALLEDEREAEGGAGGDSNSEAGRGTKRTDVSGEAPIELSRLARAGPAAGVARPSHALLMVSASRSHPVGVRSMIATRGLRNGMSRAR